MLGEKLDQHNSNCWLINTGWTEGAFPNGHRISLKYTRAIISAILNNDFESVPFKKTGVFNLAIPASCNGVPTEILDPVNTWTDSDEYHLQADKLANLFTTNFNKYSAEASPGTLAAAPQTLTSVVI